MNMNMACFLLPFMLVGPLINSQVIYLFVTLLLHTDSKTQTENNYKNKRSCVGLLCVCVCEQCHVIALLAVGSI